MAHRTKGRPRAFLPPQPPPARALRRCKPHGVPESFPQVCFSTCGRVGVPPRGSSRGGSKKHCGEWRSDPRTGNCNLNDPRTGTGNCSGNHLCMHGDSTLSAEHWTCCGSLDKRDLVCKMAHSMAKMKGMFRCKPCSMSGPTRETGDMCVLSGFDQANRAKGFWGCGLRREHWIGGRGQ